VSQWDALCRVKLGWLPVDVVDAGAS
jgi:hypothetical protein